MFDLDASARVLWCNQTVDEAFNHEDRKFKSLETAVRQLTRDINAYMEQVKVSTC